jgi:hypothetical protein
MKLRVKSFLPAVAGENGCRTTLQSVQQKIRGRKKINKIFSYMNYIKIKIIKFSM